MQRKIYGYLLMILGIWNLYEQLEKLEQFFCGMECPKVQGKNNLVNHNDKTLLDKYKRLPTPTRFNIFSAILLHLNDYHSFVLS